MTAKTGKSKARASEGEKIASVDRTSKGGRDAWVITTADGERRTVVTSPKSVARIKEASKKYEGALKRLADR